MANIFDLFKQISSDNSPTSEKGRAIEFLLVGLGNPGREYERTRHNAGFMAMDYLAGRCDVKIDRAKFSALVGEGAVGEHRVLFMKPQTYMNSSGEAVAAAARFYKLPAESIIVISDDVSLDVGRIRVRREGSHGGQKGLKSIEECLGSRAYRRIKIGVGAKPHPDYDMAAWVLSSFEVNEMKAISENYSRIYDGIKMIMDGDIEQAMQLCNGK